MKTILNLQEIEEAVIKYLNISLEQDTTVTIEKSTKKGVSSVQAIIEYTPFISVQNINDGAPFIEDADLNAPMLSHEAVPIQNPVLFSSDL